MGEAFHHSFKVIAHRGNSWQAPDNTRASFQQAIDLKADFIECDVQLTKDLVPVISHDSTTHHLLPKCKVSEINEINWENLKELDAGSWFDKKFSDQRILSLEEFLLIPKGNVGAMIEFKEETIKEDWMAKIAGDRVRSHARDKTGPILIGSLAPAIIIWLQDYLPEQDFIAIVGRMKELDIFLKETRSKTFAIRKNLLTQELIHSLREEGKEVWTWTVNDLVIAKRLVEDGVQGLITNHPKKMQLLREDMPPF